MLKNTAMLLQLHQGIAPKEDLWVGLHMEKRPRYTCRANVCYITLWANGKKYFGQPKTSNYKTKSAYKCGVITKDTATKIIIKECNEKRHFYCQFDCRHFVTTTTTIATKAKPTLDPPCQGRRISNLTEINPQIYYKYMDEPVSFETAFELCKKDTTAGIPGQLPVLSNGYMIRQYHKVVQSQEKMWAGLQIIDRYTTKCGSNNKACYAKWANGQKYQQDNPVVFYHGKQSQKCGTISQIQPNVIVMDFCNQKHNYYCQFDCRLFITITTTPTPKIITTSTTTTQPCNPEETSNLYELNENIYYIYMEERKPFAEASKSCKDISHFGKPGQLSVLNEVSLLGPFKNKTRKELGERVKWPLWVGLRMTRVGHGCRGQDACSGRVRWVNGKQHTGKLLIFYTGRTRHNCGFILNGTFMSIKMGDCMKPLNYFCQFHC